MYQTHEDGVTGSVYQVAATRGGGGGGDVIVKKNRVSFLPASRWPSGKASASRAEDPGFESRLRRDFFGVESYQ